MKNIFIITEDMCDKYLLSEKIQVNNQKISVLLLKDILSNKEYYEYAKNIFKEETRCFEMLFNTKKYKTSNIYTKRELLTAIKIALESKKLELNEEEKANLNELINFTNYNYFIEKNKNESITVKIDGQEVTVYISDIINFFELSDNDYEEFYNLNKQPYINGIPKQYFCYAIVELFAKKRVLNNYAVPQKITDRYNDIYRSKKIDTESLNEIIETIDDNIGSVVLNKKLKEYILKDMPTNILQLEQAIYVYIKLCKTLRYDEEFFVFDQKGEIAEKHEDINYITTITPQNNKAVCYEFIEIYAKFLEGLGINFITSPFYPSTYGGKHTRLEFRTGKFLISVDPLKSILKSDLLYAKLNEPLTGINCTNDNKETQNEFKQTLTKIYDFIMNSENENLIEEQKETYETILKQYNLTEKIDFNTKIRILLTKLYESSLTAVELLGYSLKLVKTIFKEEEQEEKISITIIKNNIPIDDTQNAMASAVITINRNSFINEPNENMYYIYTPKQKLKYVTREQLTKLFEIEILEYIDYKDPRVPGLEEKRDKTNKYQKNKYMIKNKQKSDFMFYEKNRK